MTADARPWQFSIRHLLTTTFVLAVMLAAGKLGFEHGNNVRLGIAIALFAGSVIGIGFVLYFGITRGHAVSPAERMDEEPQMGRRPARRLPNNVPPRHGGDGRQYSRRQGSRPFRVASRRLRGCR